MAARLRCTKGQTSDDCPPPASPHSSFVDNTFAGLTKSTKPEGERQLFSDGTLWVNRLGWFPRPIFAFTQVTTKRDALGVALIVAGVLLLIWVQ
jgi:hypothetical protein